MIAHVPVLLAKPDEALQIAEMSRRYIEHGLPWGWTETRVLRAIRDPDTNVVVVKEQGSVAGFGIMSYGDEDAHLLLLAVRHDCRRRGIGSALVGWLEQTARAAGASRIDVEARWQNDAARCFYSEHGYNERAIKKAMYGGAESGVVLGKWLRSGI